MLFRFLILSDEADDFKLEVVVDSEATFSALYNVIMDAAGYTKDQMASFFVCDSDWSKKTEITLVEMDTSPEVDSYVMDETQLEELLEDEGQKLLFVFDYLTERAFFMELREIITGKTLKNPQVKSCKGTPPPQFVDFDDVAPKIYSDTVGEDFYGDSDYDPDELDSAGFGGFSDEDLNDSIYDDERY